MALFLKNKANHSPKNQDLVINQPIGDLSLYFVTNIGLNRDKNDDYALASKNHFQDQMILVCDGLGGYLGGQTAAQIVGQTILSCFLSTNFASLGPLRVKRWFVEGVNNAKIKITKFITNHPEYQKMATTLAMAIITPTVIYCFNIGDSRIYGIKDHQLHQISVDQNLYNQLKKQNLSDAEIRKYNLNLNSIVNYIGQFDESELKYDFYHFKVDSFDYLFATTDGIHNYISSQRLLVNFFNYYPLAQIADQIINDALSQMSNDNLSIAIAQLKK